MTHLWSSVHIMVFDSTLMSGKSTRYHATSVSYKYVGAIVRMLKAECEMSPFIAANMV